jgi:MtN3 and saliva related transmembrane protein
MLENFVDLFAVLATVFGTVMSFANYPQTYEIVKNRSSKDVSIVTYLILAPGTFIWVLYGISLGNWPMIITNALGLIGVFTVIIVYYMYK